MKGKRCAGSCGAAVLVLAASLSSCVLWFGKEKEPNDSPRTAQALSSGKTIRASIERAGDIDYFRITWKKGGQEDLLAAISVQEQDNLDLVIKLYDGNRVAKVIDDTEGRGERIVNALFTMDSVTDGSAVFSVEHAADILPMEMGREPQYELTVKVKVRERDEEGEPNDKMVHAIGMVSNLAGKGFFNPSLNVFNDSGTEEDWWSFRLAGDEPQVIRISLSAVPGVDSVLSLYDDLGYLVRESNSHGSGEAEKLANLWNERAQYYVRIATATPYQQNYQVGYSIKIEGLPGEGREGEPNDRYPLANSLSFSQDLVGNCNPAGDVDWFAMSVFDPARQVLTVRVSPTAELDPIVELYSAAEDMILRVNDRAKDEGEIIRNIGVEQGLYYLKIYDSSETKDNPDRDYTLIAEKNPWQEDDEFEINDEPQRANGFALGSLKKGYITPKGDRDVYEIHIDKPMRVTAEVTPCALLDFELNLFDQPGQLLVSINDNPVEEGERGSILLNPGTYYVEVKSINESENSRDAYNLRIYRG